MGIRIEFGFFGAIIPDGVATSEEYETARQQSWNSFANNVELIHKCHSLGAVARDIGNAPVNGSFNHSTVY